MRKPSIVITMGDPAGIGPEIITKALCRKDIIGIADYHLIGDYHPFRQCAQDLPKAINVLDLKTLNAKNFPKGINPKNGKASLSYIDVAMSLLKASKFSALVTGPICKESIQMVKPDFRGHTEYLADFFSVKRYEMMFVAKKLKVVVATRHIPLSKVAKTITIESLCQTIQLTGTTLKKVFRISNPKIAICGLNPHAGEGGRIGVEEKKIIIPAIQKAKRSFKNVSGPLASDTVFCPFIAKRFDAVIAIYHDQGAIPIKMTAFNKLVNLTIGLPIVRTSPAHGTAFDIAGKNKADPSSMIEAIKLAVNLSK